MSCGEERNGNLTWQDETEKGEVQDRTARAHPGRDCLSLRGVLASVDVVRSAFQSMRGSRLTNNCGLSSTSSLTSSASLGCSGNESDDDLHVLTAQVRKFNVRTFILAVWCGLSRKCFAGSRWCLKVTKKLHMLETGPLAPNEGLDMIPTSTSQSPEFKSTTINFWRLSTF